VHEALDILAEAMGKHLQPTAASFGC